MDLPKSTREALIELLSTYHELNSNFVEIHEGPPSALEFLQFIQKNRPVIFRGAATRMKPTTTWNTDYLRSMMGFQKIIVAETPLGNADSAVLNSKDGIKYFVKPHQTEMEFGTFIDHIQDETEEKHGTVKYSQSQNNNIAADYAPLAVDVERDIPWASQALDRTPDAINVWIGNERSISAMHKDNYENLYCQVIGRKIFTLISPLESICVKETCLPAATYVPYCDGEPGHFTIVPDEPPQTVPFWPVVDPDIGDPKSAWWKHCRPMRAELEPGDILYLPAMWYHKVSQECSDEGICCALNYWYDMEFSGLFYPAINFIKNIGVLESEVAVRETKNTV